jgi:hypothetical protein
MSVVLGSGEHRYRVVENWAKLPDGWSFKDVAAVAVDGKDQVYVFNRGEHPMMVFDRAGNFRAPGAGSSAVRTACTSMPDDILYCTDDGDHSVRRCSTAGKIEPHHRRSRQARPLRGRRAVPSLHAHRLSPKGRHLRLGRLRQCARAQVLARRQAAIALGQGPAPSGQFNIAHNIATDDDGWSTLPIARTTASGVRRQQQIRERSGTTCTARAASIAAAAKPDFVISELGPGMPVNLKAPNLGPRLSIVDGQGKLIARLGGKEGPGLEPGKFIAPHGLALDSKGDIYVGEVSYTNWKTSFPDKPMPTTIRSLQKLEKVS